MITADYLPDNIAHKYSDEYCNVSITELKATLKAAEEKKIDGVISFACDPGVVTVAYVAEKLGLPSAGALKTVLILQNKAQFRAFLTENSFRIPITRGFTDEEQ